jgi:hypothetical protein
MNKIFSFLRRPQFGPFFIVVSLVCTFAFLWLCKINYQTTYNQLVAHMPQEAAKAFTLVIQGFEFLIPILTLLGIMITLEMSKLMRIILYACWMVVMLIDFSTAYLYFIGFYPNPMWIDYIISISLSGVFLFAEVFVILSGVSLAYSISFWKTGVTPSWLSQQTSMTLQTKTEESDTGGKVLRETKGGHQLLKMPDGSQKWIKKEATFS